jgi:DoxX-like family
MQQRDSSSWYPLVGLGCIITGTDKLFGMRAYRRMFRDLGWSEENMQLIGAAEVAGGTLLAARTTRLMGGALLAGASVAVLGSELRHQDGSRALARLAVLAGVVTAVWPLRSAR